MRGQSVPHPTLNFPIPFKAFTRNFLKDRVQIEIKFKSKDLPSLKVVKIPAQGKSRGTVLFLCGGPSACSQDPRTFAVPPDVDVIQFDYLGLGQTLT